MESSPSKSLSLMQVFILGGITTQITAFTLCQRYSLGVLKEKYHMSTLLVCAETIKFVVSLAATSMRWGKDKDSADRDTEMGGLIESGGGGGGNHNGTPNMWVTIVTSSLPMLLPALVYVVQNMLTFVSLTNIDAGTYTLLSQAKLVTVAIFARIIMSKVLNRTQWRAILSLTLAVFLLTYSQLRAKDAPDCGGVEDGSGTVTETAAATASETAAYHTYMLGVTVTLCNVSLSGFSTNFMEYMFKGVNTGVSLSVWERNLQLSAFSVITNLIFIFFTVDGGLRNMFQGITKMAAFCACLMAFGGILVALSLKYTDSLLKSMAVSLSIVLTPLCEMVTMGTTLTPYFLIGAAYVIISIQDYNDASSKNK